jgi:hypothetical protein
LAIVRPTSYKAIRHRSRSSTCIRRSKMCTYSQIMDAVCAPVISLTHRRPVSASFTE